LDEALRQIGAVLDEFARQATGQETVEFAWIDVAPRQVGAGDQRNGTNRPPA
jgi:hypothetical protein